MTVPRIVWLHSPDFSDKGARLAKALLRAEGIDANFVMFECAAKKFPRLRVPTGKKGEFNINPEVKPEALRYVADVIKRRQPDIVVVNDNVSLKLLTGQKSIQTTRGSIYDLNGVPTIVLDTLGKVYFDKVAQWMFKQDLQKLKRYLTNGLRREPGFNIKVCTNRADVDECAAWCDNSLFVSVDIETSKTHITSISWTFLGNDGVLHTYVVPFVSPLTVDGCYWEREEDEIYVWGKVKSILEHPIIKALQNASFDCAWFVIYRMAPINIFLDTMHMWHATFCEAKKSLETITSVCVDRYRYWKDEIKGETTKDKKTGKKRVKTSIPKTPKGFAIYLNYNGLDTHYTACSAIYLLRLLTAKHFDWALRNYIDEWSLQSGPYFAMSMRGLRVNEDRQSYFYTKWMGATSIALEKLRIMCDDPTFNPNSSLEVISLLYDVLGAQSPNLKGKQVKKDKAGKTARSADEKILKFVRLQHPILGMFIDAIQAVKKPLNQASKYGRMELLAHRFMYGISMTTESGRTASKGHALYYGTNAQNVPGSVRPMCVADKGKIFFDPDYAQSDAWFVAFYSQDAKFIENILSPRDTHCIHAEFFFKDPYDKIYKAYKAKDPWAVDPIKGVRQNTKRIGHGANYQMSGGTLYVVMGHEAVLATALSMGNQDAHKWSPRKFGEFCQGLVDAYLNQLYPRLPLWFKETCDEAIRNHNKVTVHGGRTRLFFGNMAKDSAIQRELSSFYGQGGTAGNINKASYKAWYNGLDAPGNPPEYDTFNLHLQVHDNFLGQVVQSNPGLRALDKFLTIMEEPVTILGRTFSVPVECDVGLSWKDGMVPYKPGTDWKELWPEILAGEAKLDAKFREGRA